MILVPLILKIIPVAGTRRLVQSGLGETMLDDLEVVLAALERSDPSKLEGYELKTGLPTIQFLYHNMDRVRRVARELDELDLSGMNLKHLPIYGMLQMTNLKRLILDDNKGLAISWGDIERIKGLPIKEVSIRSSNISLETFKALKGLPKLTRLDISQNRLLSTYTDNNKFGELATRLVDLRMADCNLGSDWLGDILQCTKLTTLDISCNENISMDQTNFRNFENLKLLKRLNVDSCNLTTANFNEICRCGGLEGLNVNNNRQLWTDVVDFGECRKSLKALEVAQTGLNEDGLRALCGLPRGGWLGALLCWLGLYDEAGFPNLTALNIGWNSTLGPVMSQEGFSLGYLKKTLVALNISFTNSDCISVIEAIGECERLAILDASLNPNLWFGADEINFGHLKSELRMLKIENTRLPSAILNRILDFDKLEALEISENDAACQDLGSSRLSVGEMRNTLKNFKLRGTGLTGRGLHWILREFSGLRNVHVGKNKAITVDDLVSVDFNMLVSKRVNLRFSANRELIAKLKKKFSTTSFFSVRP